VNKNYNKTILHNGLTIVSDLVENIGSFAVGVCINVGSRNDSVGNEGIAHFMEHAAFRHTKNRSSKQIANELENIGAYSNAWTTKELTCYYVLSITHNFKSVFNLLSDIVQNTIFIHDEIEKERSIILEEIKSYEDDPEEYIIDLIDSIVFDKTNLSHSILGTQKSVSNITIENLQSFQKNYYVPNNMLIAVAGNIKHSEIITLAEQLFDKKRVNTIKPIKNILLSNQNRICNNKKLTIKKAIQQAHIIFGKIINGYTDLNERYILAIANIIFGDGMSSRLYQSLREKYGLAYSIYSTIQNYKDCGQINIYSATDISNNEKVFDLIYKQMNLLNKSNLPTIKELKRAKEQLKTATIIELESMASRIMNIIKQEICIGYNEDIPTIIDKIEKVSIDDVIDINAKYFNNDNWCHCSLIPKD